MTQQRFQELYMYTLTARIFATVTRTDTRAQIVPTGIEWLKK
jgi:hypothetical protein